MTDIWKEREKALENLYIHKREKEVIEKLKKAEQEQLIRHLCLDRCPKCAEPLQAMTFRGVPMDKCPGCGGIWLGPKDLQILASKDHRTWFDKWFREEET